MNYYRNLDRNWQVTEFHGVDEDSGFVYFSATIDHPTERHLYRLPFGAEIEEGNVPEKITAENGWHRASLSADRQFFIDTHSRLNEPTTVSLYSTSGEEVAILEDNQELRDLLAAYQLPPVELIELQGAGD